MSQQKKLEMNVLENSVKKEYSLVQMSVTFLFTSLIKHC